MNMYAIGSIRTQIQYYSHIENGIGNYSQGDSAHAEGAHTIAEGVASHAEGSSTAAKGIASHAEGANATARADYSHVEGANTLANGISSHAEGNSTVTYGNNSHAEGSHTITGIPNNSLQGDSAHAEGAHTIAEGVASHAEGSNTAAKGIASHAEGFATNAHGDFSHAEGSYTTTGDSEEPLQGNSSHAEGYFTIAHGDFSHSEGYFTLSRGESSHAEGLYTVARGKASHAEGAHTQSNGDFSHVEGVGNLSEFEGAHIMGKYGDAQEPYSWFIGNGLSSTSREVGAKWLASTRNMYIDGNTYVASGTGYAEMFKIKNEIIDVGFFVTFDGEYIRRATDQDDYILGITNDTSSILGNSAEMRWKEKYLVDEWGRIQHENHGTSGIIKKKAVLNPKWDPKKEYTPRRERVEWVSVGLLGQIRVRDDGTCEVGAYCSPNIEGVATKSKRGYPVIQRITSNQIIILFK